MATWFPAFFALANTPPQDRGRLTTPMMMSMVPGPAGVRAALAVVSSEQQLSDQRRTEEQVAADTVRVLRDNQIRLTPAQLQNLPALQTVLDRRPDLRALVIQQPAAVQAGQAQALAVAFAAAAQALAAAPAAGPQLAVVPNAAAAAVAPAAPPAAPAAPQPLPAQAAAPE